MEAYPLQWPAGKPRNKFPKRSAFGDHSMKEAASAVLKSTSLLGASSVVISTNVELRQDGLPYSNRKTPNDCGVALYFFISKQPTCIACDKYDSVECNLWAVHLHLEATRAIARYGVGTVAEMFSGFKALPDGNQKPSCWEVLGLAPNQHRKADIEEAFRRLARVHHPDANGDTEQFQKINAAKDQALRECVL